MPLLSGDPRVLLILHKNTSPLDYALPLLRRLRRTHPTAGLGVLYAALNKRQILRGGAFYSRVLADSGVPEYDFADFLRVPGGGALRGLFARSPNDGLRGLSGRVRRAVYRRTDEFAGRTLVDVERILPEFDPGAVLFDNRTVTDFPGRRAFYDYLDAARKPVYLLPHAPHHNGPNAFIPYDDQGEALPPYAEYWMPFALDRMWEALPAQREQFVYVGYPGLDADWLAWLRSADGPLDPAPAAEGPLRCLFIIRKFLPPGQPREGQDVYIMDYAEFADLLSLLADSVARAERATGRHIEVVVKPHPSNDYESVRSVMAGSGIARWRITEESVYATLNQIDCVVSLYSTTLLTPAMAGIPVVLLRTAAQDWIHQWPEMRQLYEGLAYYLPDPAALRDALPEVAALAAAGGSFTTDVAHLRQFYPDGAAERCAARLGLAEPAPA